MEAEAEPMLPLYTSGTPPPYTPPSHSSTTPPTDSKPTTSQPLQNQQWNSNTKNPKSFIYIGIAIVALFLVLVVPLVVLTTGGCAAAHKQRVDSHAVLKPTFANLESNGGLSGTVASGLAGRSIEGFGKMG